jgi:DMSO/TMAO reductase YedYZ molybdopterin-dependent catalytic subunit
MKIDRRKFLYLSGASISAALLSACDSEGPDFTRGLLRFAQKQNEKVERALFRHRAIDIGRGRLAGNALPQYYISDSVPVWDESAQGKWTLEITGSVRQTLRLTLEDLMKLPSITHRVNHYCVEGWTAATEWTGVRVSHLAKIAGVQPDAEYVDFKSFDSGYHESWDMESAMHTQTLVVFGREGKLLEPGHGAPARLHSPIKLGYKSTKYLTQIVFLPYRTGGYWSDQGYDWYAGT